MDWMTLVSALYYFLVSSASRIPWLQRLGNLKEHSDLWILQWAPETQSMPSSSYYKTITAEHMLTSSIYLRNLMWKPKSRLPCKLSGICKGRDLIASIPL